MATPITDMVGDRCIEITATADIDTVWGDRECSSVTWAFTGIDPIVANQERPNNKASWFEA